MEPLERSRRPKRAKSKAGNLSATRGGQRTGAKITGEFRHENRQVIRDNRSRLPVSSACVSSGSHDAYERPPRRSHPIPGAHARNPGLMWQPHQENGIPTGYIWSMSDDRDPTMPALLKRTALAIRIQEAQAAIYHLDATLKLLGHDPGAREDLRAHVHLGRADRPDWRG